MMVVVDHLDYYFYSYDAFDMLVCVWTSRQNPKDSKERKVSLTLLIFKNKKKLFLYFFEARGNKY